MKCVERILSSLLAVLAVYSFVVLLIADERNVSFLNQISSAYVVISVCSILNLIIINKAAILKGMYRVLATNSRTRQGRHLRNDDSTCKHMRKGVLSSWQI